MIIAVPREIRAAERRVGVTPDSVPALSRLGYDIRVEAGAGNAAGFIDQAYVQAGATLVTDTRCLWVEADIILKVNPPAQHAVLGVHESALLQGGSVLVGLLAPAQNPELLASLAAKNITAMALDAVPRITRAQRLDVLSSMANVAGYRAVIEAAHHFDRFLGGQITAAGTIPPARVMVIGAGVAGLAAIGAAQSLGAVVRAFDTRPEVKQQVESMGAEFLELAFAEDGSGEGGYAKGMSKAFIAAEMALFAAQCREVDIIITTALIPGQAAPVLITADMIATMKPGSIIVDLGAEQGGNCALTRPGEVVEVDGVCIIGYTDLPSRLPGQSSQLYSANIRCLVEHITPNRDGQVAADMEDEITRSVVVTHAGAVTWPPPPIKPPLTPSARPTADKQVAEPPTVVAREKSRGWVRPVMFGLGGLLLLWLGSVAPADFMARLTVFVLSCFIGFQVIWNVTPALHTPLMSVTNAISGIIIIGALLQVGSDNSLVAILAAIAIIIAAINIAGGFLVTHRMLKMFRRDNREET